jgi:hypothetical protein
MDLYDMPRRLAEETAEVCAWKRSDLCIAYFPMDWLALQMVGILLPLEHEKRQIFQQTM